MADQFELLREAIDRNTAITLSLPSAGMMRAHKSRLLELRDDAIWLESVLGQADAIDALIAAGDAVRVSFRVDRDSVEFSGTLLERIRGYKLNASTEIEALRITRPTTVKVVQRRADYRVAITPDADVSFKCWRIGEQYDFAQPLAPPASTAMAISVRDLSAGGLGGLWRRRKDEPQSLVPNQRLRVDVCSSAGTILIDARLRFSSAVPDPDCSRVGIQFALKPTSLPDRQKLTQLNKLIGDLQRAELRRVKMAR